MVTNLNQVRHLYVANSYTEMFPPAAKGAVMVKGIGDALGKEVYFLVHGYSTITKSDYIPVNSIVYAKAIKAKAMRTKVKKVTLTLSSDVNGGLPIAGQDYILRINLRQFYGMSDQDQYFKDAAVHATKNMTAATFYKEMVDALNKSFSREVNASSTYNPYLEFSYTDSGITISGIPQVNVAWSLGVNDADEVLFDVVPTTVYDGTDDLVWGKTEESYVEAVPNGYKLANLEYFLLGERGDQYRKIGWPNDIETKGLVNPAKEYDVLEIHYSFAGSGVNSYKTEKDITIVSPTSTDHAILNEVITAFNKASGLSIEALTADS